MPHDPDYHVMAVYAQLEHAGYTGGSYGMDIQELNNAVLTGYERAKKDKDTPPLSHSAYSTKLKEGHMQLMASHGL